VEAAKPVELDQARVGRLSRMDAMQAQAMSVEARRRREIKLKQIESALLRLAHNEFGDCIRCGLAIDEKRVEFDPSVLLCVSCATEAER
jgi:DnaK suppressor protein